MDTIHSVHQVLPGALFPWHNNQYQYLPGHVATLCSTSDWTPKMTHSSATRWGSPLNEFYQYGCTCTRNLWEDGLAEKAHSLSLLVPRHSTTGLLHVGLCQEHCLPITIYQHLMTWRGTSWIQLWLFMLTCSPEHGKSLNIDWTLPTWPRVPTLRCNMVS